MNHLNLSNGLIGLLAVIAGFLAKTLYRPFAYEKELTDLGIADSAPSFFYVIGFSQLLLIKESSRPKTIILLVTLGSVAYEFFQSRHQVLDVTDLMASLLGGTISIMIHYKMRTN
jgi:hypothetical protein